MAKYAIIDRLILYQIARLLRRKDKKMKRRLVQVLRRNAVKIVWVLTMCSFGPLAEAQMKQWADENGIIHYQNLRIVPPLVPVDYETMTRSINAIMVKSFSLPGVTPRIVRFVRSYEFIAALTRDFGLAVGMADDLGKFATGFVLGDSIAINEQRFLERPEYNRRLFLAHEITHVVQNKLKENNEARDCPQWVTEGSAEWLAQRIVGNFVNKALRQIPSLSPEPGNAVTDLVSLPDWIRARVELGLEATYGRAYFATDRLIRQIGLRATLSCQID